MAPHPTYIELCAGIGGISIALERCGLVPVCRVERDAYAASVLVARMEDSSLGESPIWDDLTTFDGKPWRGGVDLVAAGFPCQPFSLAGKRLGNDDERAIWPEIERIISECDPAAVFLENVRPEAFLGPFLGLRGLGFRFAPLYETSAHEVGAPHLRVRYFALAYRDGDGLRKLRSGGLLDGEWTTRGNDADGCCKAVGHAFNGGCERDARDAGRRPPRRGSTTWAGDAMGDAEGIGRGEGRPEHARLEGRSAATEHGLALGDARCSRLEVGRSESVAKSRAAAWPPGPSNERGWHEWIAQGGPQPVVRRGVDGVPNRLDRLRCLGNAVVPDCAERAFRWLMENAT